MRLRTLLLLLPIVATTQTGSAQQAAAPAQPPAVGGFANIKSPEVGPDRRVTFRIAAPKASSVSVICECLTLEEAAKLKQQQAALGQRPDTDPEMARLNRALANVRSNQGERALAKDANGGWTLTLPPVESDLYEYHFNVDGFEMLDPRNPVVKYNSRPNLIESVLDVPGASPMFYDVRPVPHGKMDIRYYDSKATGGTRRVFVYTPPNYDKSTAKLPVLYLLHGADGDETVWTTFGRVNLILDNLIADKKAAPMIVVTPAAYAYPPTTGVAGDKQRADFEKDLLGDLIPFVQANYRTAADREHRALAGLSMGGGLTLAIGPRHLDTFSRLAVFSARRRKQSAGIDEGRSREHEEHERAAENVLDGNRNGGSGLRGRQADVRFLRHRRHQAQLQDDAGRAHLDRVASFPERSRAAALGHGGIDELDKG